MSGSSSYVSVLRSPGALRVFVPALVGRLSFAMVTLSMLFAVQQGTGSFALAGAATGVSGLANVLASPFRARMVDGWGQRITLNCLTIGFAGGLIGLAAIAALPHPAAWALVVGAALTGIFQPPLGASMRVLWATIATTPSMRTRAYSLDAVAEELLFTTGPLIAAAIIATSSPSVGLIVTAGVALIGTFGMTSSHVSSSHPRSTAVRAGGNRPLRQPGFPPVLIALLGAGIVLGVIEVAAPAAATEHGSRGLAGVLLAAFAAGSGAGGLFYGHREWASSLVRRLLLLGGGMALLCGLLALAPNVLVLGIGLAVVGFFLAPSLVTGYLLADHLTSADVRTEASSWINTAVNTGAAAAAAAAGLVVDAASANSALLVGAVGAAICLALATPALARGRNRRGAIASPSNSQPEM